MTAIVVVTHEAHVAKAMVELVGTVAAEVTSDAPQVLPACSPDDVLNILAHEPIGMLIVDCRLGDMTGIDLIRWLRPGLTATTKILLTDDSRVLADPWTFGGSDINGVLPRPLGRQSLKHALERYFKRSLMKPTQSVDTTE